MLRTRQKVLMMVTAIAFFLMGNLATAAAQDKEVNLFIGNLTKGEITELIISPSSKHFPENRSCMVFEDLQGSDGSVFGVILPDYVFSEADIFDIEIVVGGKRLVTKNGVKINFSNGKKPTLYLSTTEKDLIIGLKNAVPNVAAAAFFATTKRIAPKVLLKTGASALTKAGIAAFIPYAGWIVAGGILLVEVAFFLHDYVLAAGDLWVQVDYN